MYVVVIFTCDFVTPMVGYVRSGRELELEEKVEEMKSTIDGLERKRTALKNKVLVLRQQLDAKGKRHTPYDHVQSRISSVRSPDSIKYA